MSNRGLCTYQSNGLMRLSPSPYPFDLGLVAAALKNEIKISGPAAMQNSAAAYPQQASSDLIVAKDMSRHFRVI